MTRCPIGDSRSSLFCLEPVVGWTRTAVGRTGGPQVAGYPDPMNGHSDFEALESALPDMVHTFLSDPEAPQCLVIVPSMSFDQELLKNVLGSNTTRNACWPCPAVAQPGHARHLLFQRAHRRRDRGLPPGASSPASPRRTRGPRLTMISCDDLSRRPLTEPFTGAPCPPRRDQTGTPQIAALVCMNTTGLERKLAVELGLPLIGNRRTSTIGVQIR